NLTRTTSSFLHTIQIGDTLSIKEIYNNSANILIDNSHVLNLSFKDGLLASKAAVVDLEGVNREDFKNRLRGEGSIVGEKLCFSNLHLSFKESSVFNNSEEDILKRITVDLVKFKENCHKFTNFLKLIEFESVFLNVVLKNKISYFKKDDFKYALFRKVSTVINKIRRDLKNGNLVEKKIIESLTALLGLGWGLTPSGDDFYTGFYTIRKILNQKFNIDMINPLILGDKNKISPLILNLLNDIEDSYYPEIIFKIIDLISGYEKECFFDDFRQVQEFGHTSGEDILAGVLFGIEDLK
ncbi:MAG TPA: DUF2877 domain-containing protein, partial [Firmicutes bacterium]|nr:DUF2877 domain-containing protein [Bacillota bacterium]